VFKSVRGAIVVMAAVLGALAALPILPETHSATAKLRSAVVVPAKAMTGPAAEEAPVPPPKANRKTKKSSPKKLVIERPPPKEPALEEPVPEKSVPEEPAPAREPAPEPERDSDRNSDEKPVRSLRAGATGVPVLPGPARPKASTEQRAFPAASRLATTESRPRDRDNRLSLSVPRLGLKDISIGDSPDQAYLDREGIMHLSGTGFPYERGSNTYIPGHADYDASRIPSIFRNLKDLQRGDHIILRDAVGRTYDYRVYKRFVVTPRDVWVTRPVPGKNIVSLQTCFPAPTFDKRLIVRGELAEIVN